MRIHVHEHVIGGGLAGHDLPASLAREGRAMLFAIAGDIAALAGVRAVMTLDARLEPPPHRDSLEVVPVRGEDASRRFRELARACDGTLVIAPETCGILAATARAVSDAGGRHLGAGADAIERASDKLLLPGTLEKAGVTCLPAEPWDPSTPPGSRPIVVKPRRGAGSERVVLVDGTRGPPSALEGEDDLIATPYVEGLAASVLVITGDGGAAPLRACAQDLSRSGDFAYLGGSLPLETRLETRARRLALAAVGALPGLVGFAGVDMILDPGKDRTRDVVVEVNARLTTSYVGLRAHARTNLAAVWLAAILGKRLPSIVWRPGETRFLADGTVARAA